MNKTLFALVLPLLTLSVAARAQSVDEALSTAQAAAQKTKAAIAHDRAAAAAKREAARVFPVKIVCEKPPKESGLPENLTFVTRLDAALRPANLSDKLMGVASDFSPKKGESAAELNDYQAISIDRREFSYALWSCDTQDYTFSFASADLARDPALGEKVRPISGRAVIETRGTTDFSGALDCKAYY